MSDSKTSEDVVLNDPLTGKERTYPYGLFSALSLVLAVMFFLLLKDYYANSMRGPTDKMVEPLFSSLFTLSFTLAVLFLCIEFRKEILSLNHVIDRIKARRKTR